MRVPAGGTGSVKVKQNVRVLLRNHTHLGG